MYGYVRVVGAILRLKLLHIIESRMLFSLLPRTIFLHSVNIHLIQFSLFMFYPIKWICQQRVRGRKKEREGMREKECKRSSHKGDRQHLKFLEKRKSVNFLLTS